MAAAVPPPQLAQGFSSSRAQSWILVSALLTAGIYAFRRVVEPSTGTSAKSASTLKTLAGAGQPPTVDHWAVSFGTAYLMLAILAMGVPELAASLAMLMVVGNVLTNGIAIASDITGLEGSTSSTTTATAKAAQTTAAAQLTQSFGSLASAGADPTIAAVKAGTI